MDIERYIRPLRFRALSPEDRDVCVGIYSSNEPGFLPAGYRRDFERWLADGNNLILVGEAQGEVVACGGVAYGCDFSCASLTFGVVHSQHHKRGFGTTLLAARLSLLAPGPHGCAVGMEVTSKSASFYSRFGFQGSGVVVDDRWQCFSNYSRVFTDSDILKLQRALAGGGAIVPAKCKIPVISAGAWREGSQE